MTEWLRIMLEEIERRRRAERDAGEEQERRQREGGTAEPTDGAGDAASAGRRS